MTNVQIMAGTLTANVADRVVSGLLLPYGEKCKSNLGEFSVDPGVFKLPEDVPGVMGVNLHHDRERPVGRTLTATETSAGIFASMSIAKTPEGDALLAGYSSKDPNTPKALSIEVRDVVIREGRAVSGDVFGSAIVDRGAFPSAGVLLASLELDDPEVPLNEADPSEPVTTEDVVEETHTDAAGNTFKTTTTTTTTVDPDGKTTETTTVVTEPTEPITEPEEKDPEMPAAKAPNTLNAAKTRGPKPLGFADITRMMAAHGANGGGSLYAAIATIAAKHKTSPETLFAALEDVEFDTAGAVANDIAALPAWLGELWSGRAFQRRVIPLLGSAPMTSLKIKGWRWLVKPEVAPWLGNKTAVASNTPTTESYETKGKRLAGAHDIAREYVDFSVPEFWDGYWRGMTESYDRQADEGTLADLLGAATLTQRGTVPVDVSPAMTQLVDGALAILDEGLPSFAVVSKDLYRDILLTRSENTLEYLNAALGLEEGTIDKFRVIPHKGMLAGTALVGAKEAATSYELPGVPIRVEALNVAQGGVDAGLFGYYGTVIHDAAALALVADDADTLAQIELDRETP